MAGITFPRHSYNLIKLFYLDNQVSGYVPEIFRIRNLQNELIFIIFLQSIRTCRMSSQDICTLGIQSLWMIPAIITDDDRFNPDKSMVNTYQVYGLLH